jgi:capsular polysaccharide transport system permease protein
LSNLAPIGDTAPSFLAGFRRIGAAIHHHMRIISALLLRELSTRYGRDNIGFLWVIAEPLIFCTAVAALWSVIRPPFESGIRVIPFTVTGYMPLILVRQTVGFTVHAVRVNEPLLYHRQITPLHLFLARFGIEFLGISLAYVVIVCIFTFLGFMTFPVDLSMVVEGWLLLAWLSFGLCLIMGALGTIFEFVERFVQVITYILIPLSGAFYMVSSLPPIARHYVMYIPFIHCFEWMRGGYFGEFVKVYHNIPYAIAWAAGLTLFGLVVLGFVRNRYEVQ